MRVRLDEIEKRTPRVQRAAAGDDYGKLTDHNGRTVDSALILCMTTNAGPPTLQSALGFGARPATTRTTRRSTAFAPDP